MSKLKNKILVWLRRDLRLKNNPALHQATHDCNEVFLTFIFDHKILAPLKNKNAQDRRIQFICESLAHLQEKLSLYNTKIIIKYGDPVEEIPQLAQHLSVQAVYLNRDYSPYPLDRDKQVKQKLESMRVKFKSFQDHVMIEPDQLLNKQNNPYKVFTPYANAWREKVSQLKSHNNKLLTTKFTHHYNEPQSVKELLKIAGFDQIKNELIGGENKARENYKTFEQHMNDYEDLRNFPYQNKTSKLSVYIRHGCISVQEIIHKIIHKKNSGIQCWLNELIWREFYQMITYHYPYVKNHAFKEKYQNLNYPGSKELLIKWKEGRTGFPIIDAAMRCLNQTGWMHNRLRMLTASFLCKIALVDWKHGERYFAWKLLDYEFASNNGGWQWASSTGCDSAPYFRIFNPETQSKTYDKEGLFIKSFCPELTHCSTKDIHAPPNHQRKNYPSPMVSYKENRLKAIELYKKAS